MMMMMMMSTFVRFCPVVKLPSYRWGIPKFETTRLVSNVLRADNGNLATMLYWGAYRVGNDSFYALYVVLDG